MRLPYYLPDTQVLDLALKYLINSNLLLLWYHSQIQYSQMYNL